MRTDLKALMAAGLLAATSVFAQQIQRVDQPYDDGGSNGLVIPIRARTPAEAAGDWRIETTDGSLSRALRRWARDARYPILWEADKDLPAVTAAYRGTFLTALEQVMSDTQTSAYPMHACAYDNVVRVIHTSQTCAR